MNIESFNKESEKSGPEEELSSESNENQQEVLDEGFENIKDVFDDLAEAYPGPDKLSPMQIELYGVSEGKDALGDLSDDRLREKTAKQYEEHDPGFTEFKNNLLQDQVRNSIGESFGLNFQSDFMELPHKVAETKSHEPWYDIMGTISYARTVAESEINNLSEAKEEEYLSKADKLEGEVQSLLANVKNADPNALAYGMQYVSEETKSFLWNEIQDKYSDQVSVSSLEKIVRRNAGEEESGQAWEIFKDRPNVPLIKMLRISEYAEGTPQKEAASQLLSRLEALENQAKQGDKEAVDQLKPFGYQELPEKYQSTKESLKEKARQ